MAEQFFTQLLRMSLSGAVVALVVIAVRALLKRAPRAVVCVLWTVVLFRLLCPFSVESAVGLLPAQPRVAQRSDTLVQTAVTAEPVVPAAMQAAPSVVVPTAENPSQVAPQGKARSFPWWTAALCAWAAGVAGMGLYSAVSLLRLKGRLRGAMAYDKGVYVVPGLSNAFVLGVLHPSIYLPDGLDARDRSYILMHEHTHIRRGDHIWKLLMQATLCVHWFNPVVWLCSALASRDLELACDEAVIRRLGAGVKKQYSETLLRMAAGRVSGVTLAFGQGDTKGRIRHVLRYKRPALWLVAAAAVAVAGLCIGLACNQPAQKTLLRAGGALYEWDGKTVDAVPAGSVRLGAVESLRRGKGTPERDFEAVNLDEQCADCALYGDGADTLYLQRIDGTALTFRCTQPAQPYVPGHEEVSALTGIADAQVVQTIALQGGRVFAGYLTGENLGACSMLVRDGQPQLGSRLLVSGLARQQGVAVGSLTLAGAQYDALLLHDERIAHVVRTQSDGSVDVIDVGSGALSLYVLDSAPGARYAYYDANGDQLFPSIYEPVMDADSALPASGGAAMQDVHFTGIQWIVDGQVRYERDFSGVGDALTTFLTRVYGDTLVRSAAWPVSQEMLPGEYVRAAMADGEELLFYEFPELGSAVVQLDGAWWMTLPEADWQMLRQVVMGAERPEVWSAARCSGEVELSAALLEQPLPALAEESLWEKDGAAPQTQRADMGENYFVVTRTALDGSQRQAAVYERDGKIMFQLLTGERCAELPDGQQTLEQLNALLPEVAVVRADLDGDGAQDAAWWEARRAELGEVTLYIALGNGRVLTHPVQAVWGESVTAADVTGDGVPELIAMADTGGNGGMGCHTFEVLRVTDGALESLPIPFQTEDGLENGDWFSSGFRFETQYEEGFKLHVRSELLDRVIDFSGDAEMMQDRIDVGQFDETGKLLRAEEFANGSCDGISAYELLNYDRSPGLELRVYQYLWQWGHSDGVGFGVTVLKWDEEKQAFSAMEQSWTKEINAYMLEVPGALCEGRAIVLRLYGQALDYGYGISRVDVMDENGTLLQNLSIPKAIEEEWDGDTFEGHTESARQDGGLTLQDVNFDGLCDLALDGWRTNGANQPRYYWVWDDDEKAFVYAFSLCNAQVDAEARRLRTVTREDAGTYLQTEYEWRNGALVEVERHRSMTPP